MTFARRFATVADLKELSESLEMHPRGSVRQSEPAEMDRYYSQAGFRQWCRHENDLRMELVGTIGCSLATMEVVTEGHAYLNSGRGSSFCGDKFFLHRSWELDANHLNRFGRLEIESIALFGSASMRTMFIQPVWPKELARPQGELLPIGTGPVDGFMREEFDRTPITGTPIMGVVVEAASIARILAYAAQSSYIFTIHDHLTESRIPEDLTFLPA